MLSHLLSALSLARHAVALTLVASAAATTLVAGAVDQTGTQPQHETAPMTSPAPTTTPEPTEKFEGAVTLSAESATPDRLAWQDRVQELEGVEARELVRLHGELLACGWLEQNTGATPVLKHGSAPACYRVTPLGLRALKQLRAEAAETVHA